MNSAIDPRALGVSPAQIPRSAHNGPTLAPTDACVNFNLTDGRIVCLSVPAGISDGDVPFILAILQAHVAAVARRSHRPGADDGGRTA